MILLSAREGTAPSGIDPLVYSEVVFSIQHEMTHHLRDYVFLRTSDVFFDPKYLKDRLEEVTKAFAVILMWDKRQKDIEVAAMGS